MNNNNLVIHPKRAKGDDGYKVFSIRVKEETVARIDNVSSKTGRSRNELIGTFLDYALDHCSVEELIERDTTLFTQQKYSFNKSL